VRAFDVPAGGNDMRIRFFGAALLLAISPLCSGCVAIGSGSPARMSIADEIQELKEARDHGKITHEEFHLGMAALHRHPN
jgi:hypothetical protein